MTTIVETFIDRRNYSPPFVGYCPMIEQPFTICEWRPHLLRQRFALVVCPYCSEQAGCAQEHAIELLAVRS